MLLIVAWGMALGATPQPSNSLASATGPAGRRPNRPAWRTPTYTLVARDMDLRTAFDTFAVSQGLSIVMSESVAGRFSGDFRDEPTDEFLDKMATVHNLTWYYDGAALYLYGAGEVQTLLLDLQYMKAGELRKLLADLGVEDARFPLRTASNDELIMVSGPPRYVAIVSETVAKADKLRELRTFNEVEVRIFPLVHTWADDVNFSVSSPESSVTIKGVARLLEEMMNGGGGQKALDAAVVGSSTNGTAGVRDQLDATLTAAFRPVIRADNRLNAVVVRDVKSRLPMYGDLIRKLDVPQKLVEIAVTVVELSKNDALDWQLSLAYGTKWGHSDAAAGQNAQNLFSPDALAGKGLAGSLTHIHSAYSLATSLSALREKGKARNISRTTLLTVNNLAAQLTDKQSYHARVVGTEVAVLEEVSAGTQLRIKPRIIPAPSTNVPSQVWLTLQLDDGGFESITVDSMPMTRASTLQTQTAVFENESVMLAGYLRDIEESAGWGIPYLRDIPWIGWIFGGASTKKETVQRMFVFTPHIVDLDSEMLARLQATRLRDIVEEEKMGDDADDSDLERRQRDLERKHARARRREQADDRYKRRREELSHDYEMRQLERKRGKYLLDEDKHGWRRAESEERERMEAERAEAVLARRKAEEAERAEKEKAAEEKKKAEEAKKKESEEKTSGWLWW
ncbi:MAG: type III secretion system outer membrane ring subunit SctC [Kiritimatiellae bacterium]|nr:type III secretion system outer membrane ring subunit SctC [Kiritimatiellia bacterium]